MRKIGCHHCAVRARSVIADLPVERLDEFSSCGTVLVYKTRQILFHEATPSCGIYIVCRGSVKLYQSNRFGRDHVLGVVSAGGLIGEVSLDEETCCSTSAEALADTQVRHLSRLALGRLLEMEPRAGLRLIALLSASLAAARRKAAGLALQSAEARMAELLIELSVADDVPGPGSRIILPQYSRRDLAEMIGVTTETAIRLLTELKRKGIVRTVGRAIEISDLPALERLATRGSTAVCPVIAPAGTDMDHRRH